MKKPEPKLNKPLFRKVIKHILAEPLRLNMAVVEIHKNEKPGDDGVYYDDGQIRQFNYDYERESVSTREREFAKCDTAACFAGWGMILNGDSPRKRKGMNWDLYGRKAFGLNERRAEILFHVDNWPHPFRYKYQHALTDKAAAKVAAALLQKVLDTNGGVLDYEAWDEKAA